MDAGGAGRPRILHVAASPKGEAAWSWRIAEFILTELDGEVLRRRLDLDPPALPSAAFAADMMAGQTAEAAAALPSLALSEVLIGELETTDVLLISTPMHNFTLPAALKAWIDQVVRFGRTFRSTPEGKIGLLQDRPTFVAIAAGGPISPPAARQPDFLRPYLVEILACIGIRDVRFVVGEGFARGPEAAAAAEAAARAQMATALARG